MWNLIFKEVGSKLTKMASDYLIKQAANQANNNRNNNSDDD